MNPGLHEDNSALSFNFRNKLPLCSEKLWAIAVIIPVSLTALFGQERKTTDKQPNILVFIADDAGMDFGCYGNKGIQTPNIDKLAEEGLKYNRAFLTSSQCSPSRNSLLSGQFAHTVGVEDLATYLDSTIRIIPYYLQKQGYYTGAMLKLHIGLDSRQQFNWYDNGMSDWRNGTWNQKALQNFHDFLESSDGKPFFMWVGFVDPHRPYGGSLNSAPGVHNSDDVTVPPYLVDSRKTREDLAQYYDAIHRMDKHIGDFLEELEKRSLSENTLVIFLSDNGFPFPRGKATVYDAGIQTPLIMKWEGHIVPGAIYDELVSMIDLAPTLLEIAGSDIPEEMYGNSFAGIFNNQNLPGREYIFAGRNWHSNDANMRCIRSKKYKLIINTYTSLPFPITADYWRSGSWTDLLEGRRNNTLNKGQKRIFEFPRPSVELYDMESDPYELVDLSTYPEYADIMEILNDELLKWQIETKDTLPPAIPRMDIIDRQSGFPYNTRRIRLLSPARE